eukprot:TRINITY_DN5875_c0_g1_i1.p1 TRINITY_DN5875_c0_g1~~TRINITY_DN5875_c0_g1_i1.p1  ORF type:complete len:263 (+),score=49.41 TRINITY_DN5875_c0_g1_i1:56-844(+)
MLRSLVGSEMCIRDSIRLPFSEEDMTAPGSGTDVGFLILYTLWWHYCKPKPPYTATITPGSTSIGVSTSSKSVNTGNVDDEEELNQIAMLIAGGGGATHADQNEENGTPPPASVEVIDSIGSHFTGITFEDLNTTRQYVQHCQQLHQQWIQCRSVLQHYAMYVSISRGTILSSSQQQPSGPSSPTSPKPESFGVPAASIVAVTSEMNMSERLHQLAEASLTVVTACLLYTSDAADEEDSVDLGGRRIIEKKENQDRGMASVE